MKTFALGKTKYRNHKKLLILKVFALEIEDLDTKEAYKYAVKQASKRGYKHFIRKSEYTHTPSMCVQYKYFYFKK